MSFPGLAQKKPDSGFQSKDVVGEDHVYVIPKRQVLEESHMKDWFESEAFHEYIGFVEAMNAAVRGKAVDPKAEASDNIISICQVLENLNKLIDETPPIDQPQRFGNKAFSQWLQKVGENVSKELECALPEKLHPAIPEISVYLRESFGNGTRIDYGTGHEMAFGMFLCCLFRIGVFTMDDKVLVVHRVFVRYLDLVKRLQIDYRMEPAGSHGVWSLDDYQFLPFLWGSSQLFGNRDEIEPSMFLNERTVQDHHKKYMFLACIQYIMKVKTGHFAEHSNQLWNISGIATWSKINSGLLKMYKAEVLSKFPVIQHVLFGSLINFKRLEGSSKTGTISMSSRPLPPKFNTESSIPRSTPLPPTPMPPKFNVESSIPKPMQTPLPPTPMPPKMSENTKTLSTEQAKCTPTAHSPNPSLSSGDQSPNTTT